MCVFIINHSRIFSNIRSISIKKYKYFFYKILIRCSVDIQSIIDESYKKWKDPKNFENETEVISKYGKMFNPNNIDNLTAEDFKSFLSFNNNKHWSSLERLGNKITEDMEKLKKSLQILLDETNPIEKRIQRIRDKNSLEYHKWLGVAYYTPILLVVYPKKYPVVNDIVKQALEKTGIYPNYDSKPEWIAYPEVIPLIKDIVEKNNLSFWQIDQIWYDIDQIDSINGNEKPIDPTTEPNLWLVRAGERGQGVQTSLNNNCIRIGYDGLPGLHQIKIFNNFKEHFKKTHPGDSERRVGQVVPQIWDFMHNVKNGDFVILPLPQKLKLMAVGKVIGDYQFGDLHSEITQCRPVQWLKKDISVNEFDPEIQQWFDNRGTVHHIGGAKVVNKLKDMLKRLGVNEKELEKITSIDNKSVSLTIRENNYILENKWLSLKEDGIKEIIQNVLTANNKRLEIDENVVKRIISHLMVSKHVILVGAPGTGKTDLARRILKELGNRIIDNPEPVEAVASYEWGRYEVIGGRSFTSNKGEGSFHLGCVTNAISKKRFLLIDEFNRADMNKAFGEMFLALDHGEIQLREDENMEGIDINKKIHIPSDFRMICTMNDYDKSLLNELSYGLLRRFAFVELNVPDDKEKVKKIILERVYEKLKYLDPKFDNQNVQLCVNKFIDFMFAIKSKREIGLSSYIDVVSYLMYSIIVMKNDPDQALNDSLIDYILPQFDRLDIETIRLAHDKASEIFILKDEKGKTIESASSFSSNLNKRVQRLEELDKLFKFGETG